MPVIIIFLIIFLVLMISVGSTENSADTPIADPSDNYTTSDGFSAPFKAGIKYTITSEFGYRIDPISHKADLHSGIDLYANDGTEIVASAKGEVVKVNINKDSLGSFVMLKHDINGVTYYTGYGHMRDGSIVVEEGQVVEAKQKLGIIGKTGRATGIHVHFSLHTPCSSFKAPCIKNPRYIIDEDRKKLK